MSQLDEIIPPEIRDDSFAGALIKLGGDTSLTTYLEIGSSNGAGSTWAFVTGMMQRPDDSKARLFCMEMSEPRFAELSQRYRDQPHVHCYNYSSVLLEEFPSEEQVVHFYTSTRTNLNLTPLPIVLGWLRQDIDYLRQRAQPFNGIDHIKKENRISHFDCVLIDGSEFTGEQELLHTLGAKVIALDDVNSFKCFNCYRILRSHVGYELVTEDLTLRNGYAIFRRRY